MSFETRRFINGVEVAPGAEITELVMGQAVLGQHIKAGATCEGVQPEIWRSVVTANNRRVWTSPEALRSYEEASQAARRHVEQSLDRAIRSMFE